MTSALMEFKGNCGGNIGAKPLFLEETERVRNHKRRAVKAIRNTEKDKTGGKRQNMQQRVIP